MRLMFTQTLESNPDPLRRVFFRPKFLKTQNPNPKPKTQSQSQTPQGIKNWSGYRNAYA
jgi:hypothetical protein